MKTVFRIELALLVLAVLYTLAIARSLLIPVAMALLLGMILSPVVVWLERRKFPRALGAGLVVAALLGLLGYGLFSAIAPVSAWIDNSPRLLNELERKIYPVKKVVEELNKTADEVDDIASVGAAKEGQSKSDGARDSTFRDFVYANAQGLLMGAVMVTFLLYFFLAWGRQLVVNAAELIGGRWRRRRFLALTIRLERDISRYLFTITLINATLGVAITLVLYTLEMPDAPLWGAVGGLLNFIPYLGGVVTAILLGVVALLQFDDLVRPATILALFAALTILEGQVITPLVLGRRLALNPLVVFVSVVFWYWLWGVMGALMAVPILITLKIIATHLRGMRPLAKIIGR